MELHRLGVKLFVEDPSSVEIRDFIPIFHSWIQNQVIENHLLVDLHDYSHVHMGPGILLVAHEGNFSTDLGENRLGLFYYRKQPINGSLQERIKAIFRTTFQGCRLLEDEPELGGMQFKTDELLVMANDRLHAPNTEEIFQKIRPALSQFLNQFLDGNDFTLTHRADPKERFTVAVRTPHSMGIKALLERLS
ncbi:hypothetical protein MYX75_07625 [Acidobacteria bacterium AH-259-A15]|nr:hypothetical protein [Acidobacteria bacterium AH-259-A15]